MKPHLRLPAWADTLIFLATIAALFGALVLLASCGPEEPAFRFGEEEATLVDKSGRGHVRRPGELAAPPDVVLPGVICSTGWQGTEHFFRSYRTPDACGLPMGTRAVISFFFLGDVPAVTGIQVLR
jgi:hypothetical protein